MKRMKRECRFELRLSRTELSNLAAKSRKAGISGAELIRRAVENKEVREAPSVDVALLVNELRRLGHEINELRKAADALGFIEMATMDDAVGKCHEACRTIIDAYTGKEKSR
ncbi:MAG: hypothetical protein K5981_06885 [Clostridia bacterium]|nr:hypothetical protein [Clostridia bacterium]